MPTGATHASKARITAAWIPITAQYDIVHFVFGIYRRLGLEESAIAWYPCVGFKPPNAPSKERRDECLDGMITPRDGAKVFGGGRVRRPPGGQSQKSTDVIRVKTGEKELQAKPRTTLKDVCGSSVAEGARFT